MRIPVSILLLFIVLAEIATFILVGDAIGVAATLGLVLLAMVAGIMLVRRQGVATLNRMRADLAAGRLPARPLAEGAVVAFAGLLMILPGFLTDIAGLLLFIPAVRSALWRSLARRIEVRTVGREPLRSASAGLVELEPSEFSSTPRRGTPWRPQDSRH